MKKFTCLRDATALLFFLLIACYAYSQHQTPAFERQWVSKFGKMDTTPPAILRVAYDSQSNVDIAGTIIDRPLGTELLVAQFAPSGALNWFQTYSSGSTNHNESTAITVDDSDNIYVCGYMDSTTNFNYSYYVAQKYNSGGTLLWSQNTATHGFEIPAAIAADSHYVYISGGGIIYYATGLDYITLKLNRSTGAGIWEKTYDYNLLYDGSPALALTPYNNGVCVTGGSMASITKMDYATVFYDTNGNKIHTARASGSTDAAIAGGMAVKTDAAGYTYVTGMVANTGTGYDIKTIKYDSTGTVKWNKDFDYQGYDDAGHDLLVDADSNVYVCGQGKSHTTDNDFVLLKYNYKGDLIWQKFFDGAGRNDSAGKMCFDVFGDVVLTGESMTADGNFQFLTLAYDTAGNLLMKDFYGGCSGDSKALDIKADATGNIYVAGYSYDCDSARFTNVVLKYTVAYFVVPPDTEASNGNMLFYPNYGQIVDTSQTVRMDVWYYTINQNPKIYFDSSAVSFVFAKCDSDTATNTLFVDTLERIDMSYIQNETVANMNNKPLEATVHDNPYLNYFLAQCPNGIVNVKGAEKLVQKNVFKSIDVVYANNGAGMKFYFLVYPGGDPTNLILHFDGHQSLAINSNNLDVYGILSTFEYLMPQVYQIDTNNTRVALGWTASYTGIDSYDIGINLGGGTYNHSLPLVIECERQVGGGSNVTQADNLEYSTYYGDVGRQISYNIRTDKHTGDTYVVGSTTGNIPWVPASGVVQPGFGGGTQDAFIFK
ncbi:MAG TPA: hypothetical protein VK671_13165, partial [Mucilaginibacter sp.]|nr:hypothetical protein [Mucilaginibacter sp.]